MLIVEKQFSGWNWKRVNGEKCHGYESVESNYLAMRQLKYMYKGDYTLEENARKMR